MSTTPPHQDALLADVHRLARHIAAGDSGLRRRGDVDADDIAQDVAMEFDRQRVTPEAWRSWVRRTTRRRLADLARKHDRRPYVPDEALHLMVRSSRSLSERVAVNLVWADVLAKLGERKAGVLADRLAGYSNTEIAEFRGYASAAVVSTLLSRIKKQLVNDFPDLEFDLNPSRPYDRHGGAAARPHGHP